MSFLGFSTNRRAMGNFMLNITLFETVLTGRQELLKPDDLSNFVEWTPEDFKYLNVIEFPEMVKPNRMINTESFSPWGTGVAADGNYTGDPF